MKQALTTKFEASKISINDMTIFPPKNSLSPF